jgi:hypothetical protein
MSDRSIEKPGSQPVPSESAAIEHLKMLQAIITRLAGNSAQCKSWCITIVSAIVAFAGAMKEAHFVALGIIPIVIFGFLDAAYLANERAYRDLYNAIAAKLRDGSYGGSDMYRLSAPAGAARYVSALGSWSVWPVYLGLIVAYVLMWLTGFFK